MSNQPKSLSVRAQLCQQIMEDLFKADKARLQRRLSRALAEVEGEASNSAFHYKGKTYFVTGLPAVRGAHVIDVSPTIIPQLESYLEDKNQVERDEAIIKQLVAALLHECEDFQDIRDALPDAIVPQNILAEKERTRPAGYPFQTNPRLLRQFKKYEDVIFQYAAAKLLY